jgi:hypothetical protein
MVIDGVRRCLLRVTGSAALASSIEVSFMLSNVLSSAGSSVAARLISMSTRLSPLGSRMFGLGSPLGLSGGGYALNSGLDGLVGLGGRSRCERSMERELPCFGREVGGGVRGRSAQGSRALVR